MIRSPLHAACAAGLVFAMTCAAASAQEPMSSFSDRLEIDNGMTLISDGLYAQTIGTTQSYVAVSPAGHQALTLGLRLSRLFGPACRAAVGPGTRHAPVPCPAENETGTGDRVSGG